MKVIEKIYEVCQTASGVSESWAEIPWRPMKETLGNQGPWCGGHSRNVTPLKRAAQPLGRRVKQIKLLPIWNMGRLLPHLQDI
jgi:hypothetical protein